ncbi:pyridoxamine 5'-phosphate oxidase family protein [Chloroflexota bacterium]
MTEIDDIEKIIEKALCCRIGLVDDDEPYIVPVSFGYERNAFYFHTALEGRKIGLIKRNNKVCFEIDADVVMVEDLESYNCTANYRSIFGTGRAFILESDEEKSHGLKLIIKQYGMKDFDFPKTRLDKTLVVEVDINSITGKKSGY